MMPRRTERSGGCPTLFSLRVLACLLALPPSSLANTRAPMFELPVAFQYSRTKNPKALPYKNVIGKRRSHGYQRQRQRQTYYYDSNSLTRRHRFAANAYPLAEEESTHDNIPQHVAIICDGNSRWAQTRGLPASLGHAAGADRLVQMVDALRASGVVYGTFYAFSTENWSRPTSEIRDLLRIMEETCHRSYQHIMQERIRVKVLGDLEDSRIPEGLRTAFQRLIHDSAQNTELHQNKDNHQHSQCPQEEEEPFTICFALNYGGRKDIVDASLKMAHMIASGDVEPEDANEELFSRLLCTNDIPDPDLIIRTSGECRLSNFMLWNAAYAELYFTSVLWPDFDQAAWQEALEWYSQRQRKFGGRQPRAPTRHGDNNVVGSNAVKKNGITTAAAAAAAAASMATQREP